MAGIDTKVGLNNLIRVVNKLDDKGRTLILNALNSQISDGTKQKVLVELRTHVSATDIEVRNWLVKGISTSYVLGANLAVKELKSISFKTVAGMPPLTSISVELLQSALYLKPHLQAVNALLSSAYLDFGNTMTGYVRGAENILNDALKRQIRSTIAEGRLEGSSVADIKKIVKSTIGDRGFTVLLDRGGREWSLGNYSEMITRTHLIKANVEATINRASDFDVDIVEISSHGADDALCVDEEGKIYSISGKSENYEPLDGHEPPYHPACRHTCFLRPDLQ